jgi:hypothetical protein
MLAESTIYGKYMRKRVARKSGVFVHKDTQSMATEGFPMDE